MVLENSQNLQTTSTLLLDFNPECLEATLHGSASRTPSPNSNVAMILGKLQEQIDASNTVSLGNSIHNKGHKLFSSLFQDSSEKKVNNNDCSDFSHLLIRGSEAEGTMEFVNGESWVSSDNTSIALGNQHQMKLDCFNDEVLDSVTSQGTSSLVKPYNSFAYSTYPVSLKRSSSCSSFTSSSDDGSLFEDNILADPKCSQKVEQALKLGYSEQNVTEALTRLGPECAINDLLSELIRLETSNSELLSCESLPSEANLNFHNDVPHVTRARSDYMSLMSVDSSSSADLLRDNFDSASLGSSVLDADSGNNLCDIIIDGSNVAMSHGKTVFSCKGIQIAVDWFRARGHKVITVFVPQWRKETSQPSSPITDQEILYNLEQQGIIVFTPARRVKGRRVVCYDDRYVLKLALETDGIVVSNDVYRDLVKEKEDFRKVVDQKLLMYSFVNDRFMPPEDPLGRLGPTLDDFLRKTPLEPNPKPQDCPYGKKCTYGNKCRFYHPKGGFFYQNSVAETLKEQTHLKIQERASKMSESAEKGKRPKQKLTRTRSLAPLESLSSSVSAGGEAKSKKGKPKFGHSASLVFPTKSSDYLNEPRKKLEEAELTAALKKLSARDASFVQKLPELYLHGDSERKVNSKASSLRSSPALQKDACKENIVAINSQLEQTSQMKSLNTGSLRASISPMNSLSPNSPRASPSFLNASQAESSEGYLSGHLLLAKKLSYESNESSFFSEHTSSNSSTRTSSPIVSSGKISEQKQIPKVDNYSQYRQDHNPGYFDLPIQFHPNFQQQQQHLGYDSQINQQLDLPRMSSLNIFEDRTSPYSQNFDSGIISSQRYDSGNIAQCNDYFLPNVDPRSLDSGLQYASNPNQGELEYQPHHFKSYPLSSKEEAIFSQQYPCLYQTDRLTDNVRSIENVQQNLGRRFSGISTSLHGEKHSVLKQHSMPAQEKANIYQFKDPHGFSEQHNSLDPQNHSFVVAGKHQDMLSSSFDAGNSTRNTQDIYFPQSQQQQHYQSHPPGQFDQHDILAMQQEQQQQQSDPTTLFSHLLSKPITDPWGQPIHLDNKSSLDGATQSRYIPRQNDVPFHNHTHLPHFQTSTSVQNITPGSDSYTSLFLQSPIHYPPPPAIKPPLYALPPPFYVLPPPSMQSQPTRPVSSSSPNYPPPNISPKNNIQAFQPPRSLALPSEDSPILPEDPSFSIYYHLSSIFGEQIVKTVLNRNPGVTNPDQVCRLIIQYKEMAGI